MTTSPNQPKLQRFEVTRETAGGRLDAFLGERLTLSRAQVRRLLGSGVVFLDNHRARESDKGKLLGEGLVIEVDQFTAPDALAVTPQPELELRILAEGDGYLVADKPAGMPVHPLEEGETGTLLNAVAARRPEIQGVGEGGLRSGVVHRLDVDTSGVLIFATTQPRWEQLRDVFREHETTKLYRAIVHGKLTGSRRETMNLIIARHKPAHVRVMEDDDSLAPSGMRKCHLTWKAVENFWQRDATLLEVTLGTGFLHQIRVMLAHLGHPIIGDRLYGDEPLDYRLRDIARAMLHASHLEACGITADSADPADFEAVLAALR